MRERDQRVRRRTGLAARASRGAGGSPPGSTPTRRPHHDHRAAGRRPRPDQEGLPPDPRRRTRHRGGRRGRRRDHRGLHVLRAASRCGAHGRPDARPRRHRGDPRHRGRRAAVEGADPDHLRPGRLRLRRAARGCQRLPAQRHPARRPGRRDPHHRRRRRRPRAGRHAAPHPPVRHHPAARAARAAAAPPRSGRPSPAASRTSSPSSPRACPTARSRPACTCPRAP